LEVTKLADRRFTGDVRAHAARDEIVDARLDVEPQLGVDVGVELRPAPKLEAEVAPEARGHAH
jgi:hypothetical protein